MYTNNPYRGGLRAVSARVARRSGVFGVRKLALLLTLAATIITALSPLFTAVSYAVSIGPNSPTATNNAWSSSANIYASDGLYASTSIAASGTSSALNATGFGFNIPSGSTINGVQVDIERYSPNVSKSAIQDSNVQLLKAGTATGTNQGATSTTWPTAEVYASYGGSSSLWGATLAPSDVNATNFGVTITAKNVKSGGGATNTAYIDHIRVKVTYTPPPVNYNQASYRLYGNQDGVRGSNYGLGASAPAGTDPYGVATADFNGDGKPDIAASNHTDNTVTINMNNGSGGFTTSSTVAVGTGPEYAVTADFNGDGKPDIAVADCDIQFTSGTGKLSVLLNNGSGGFTDTDFNSGGECMDRLAVADFNGDGKPDLVSDNSGSTSTVYNVFTWLNNGSGGFTSSFLATTGGNPTAVAAADFTDDGKPDIAVSTGTNGSVEIFSGDGSGGFTSSAIVSGAAGYDMVASDFNGDGKPDLAVEGYTTLAVLLNNGSGGLVIASNSSLAITSDSSIASGDFNGDGKPDLVVSNASAASVSLYMNDGSGNFSLSSSPSTGSGSDAEGIAIADFDGDGTFEIAVGDPGLDRIGILTVAASMDVGSPLAAQDTAATIAGDGQPFRLRMDIGVSSFNLAASGQAFKLQYAPMTTSCSTSSYSDVTDSSTVRYYDNPIALNGAVLIANANDPADGTNTTANGGVILESYQEKGATTFTNPTAIPTGKDGLWDFALTTSGAVGGQHYCMRIAKDDGTALNTYASIPEIIAPPASYTQAAYRLFTNQDGSSSPGGTLSFAAKVDYPANMYAASALAADFNKDGKQDMAVANGSSNNISILINNGSGGFNPKVDYPTSTDTDEMVAEDFNGDGNLDLAATNYSTGTVSVLLGTGTGTFGTKTDFPVGTNPKYLVAGDFNGDSKLDLAVSNTYDGTVSILLGTGTGSFGTKTDFPTNAGPQGLTTADFNKDGKLDLAVATNTNSTISILLGTGTGSFGTRTDFPAGSGAEDVATADLNGDGNLDLVTANNNTTTASVLLGAGTGSFGTKTDYTTGNGPSNTTLADFNGDGKLDLATANVNSGTVSILPGNGAGGFGAKSDFTTNSMPEPLGVGDFNGDGKPDFAVPDYIAGYTSVFMNTTAFPASIDVGAPLADQDTAATMAAYGTPFRLRLDVGASVSGVATNGQNFKLQYAPRATTCGATSASSYTDVTDTSAMQYYDNPIATNGTSFATNVNDPTDGTNTLVRQTYQEKGTTSFTNPAAIAASQDGMWDFALTSTAAANNTAYCFRVVRSDGSSLSSYRQLPEVTIGTPVVGPTLGQQLRGGQSVLEGVKTPFLF